MTRAQLILARFDMAEYRLCRGLNRGAGSALDSRAVPGGQSTRRRRRLVRTDRRAAADLRARGHSHLARHGGHRPDRTAGLQISQDTPAARAALHSSPRHHARDAAAGSLQLSVRAHAARGVVHLPGDRALSGAGVGAAAADRPDRRLAHGARTALSQRRAGRRRDRRGLALALLAHNFM